MRARMGEEVVRLPGGFDSGNLVTVVVDFDTADACRFDLKRIEEF